MRLVARMSLDILGRRNPPHVVGMFACLPTYLLRVGVLQETRCGSGLA